MPSTFKDAGFPGGNDSDWIERAAGSTSLTGNASGRSGRQPEPTGFKQVALDCEAELALTE